MSVELKHDVPENSKLKENKKAPECKSFCFLPKKRASPMAREKKKRKKKKKRLSP